MKHKQVIQSVFAAELYKMAHGFHIQIVIKAILGKLLQIKILLIFSTDSKFLYNYLVKLETTYEKCLIINVICLHQ